MVPCRETDGEQPVDHMVVPVKDIKGMELATAIREAGSGRSLLDTAPLRR